mmetsp:Transcript_81480/g.179175  ORF Transcript_81480/g.179175 Transcript_81480/m.179175 type:complete len:327 (-) Transcript_81480:75-1055(-)
MPIGKVKKWNDEKGFGFITLGDGTGDIFVHRTKIIDTSEWLAPGQQVNIEVTWDEKKGKNECSSCSVVNGPNKGPAPDPETTANASAAAGAPGVAGLAGLGTGLEAYWAALAAAGGAWNPLAVADPNAAFLSLLAQQQLQTQQMGTGFGMNLGANFQTFGQPGMMQLGGLDPTAAAATAMQSPQMQVAMPQMQAGFAAPDLSAQMPSGYGPAKTMGMVAGMPGSTPYGAAPPPPPPPPQQHHNLQNRAFNPMQVQAAHQNPHQNGGTFMGSSTVVPPPPPSHSGFARPPPRPIPPRNGSTVTAAAQAATAAAAAAAFALLQLKRAH